MSPFGIHFNLPNLPLLQDKTKNMLERSNQLMLPTARYDDDRDKDRVPSAWPSRSSDDTDRETENGRDRGLEQDTSERYNILKKTLLSQRHPPNSQQPHSSVLPHVLGFQLPQQQPPVSHQSSTQFNQPMSSLFPKSEAVDLKDVKDIKNLKDMKDVTDHDRSNEDDKNSISPPHDKSQFSPPSDGECFFC